MGASEHQVAFRVLKICIVLVTIACGILEAVEYYVWTNYVDYVNNSGMFRNKLEKSQYFRTLRLSYGGQIHGQVKIWYYIVIIISFVGTTFYLSKFRRVWDHGMRILFIEIFFFALWVSASVTNLDPWYSGPGLHCERLPDTASLQCRLAMASIVMGWINVFFCLVSLLVACKRSIELAHMGKLINNTAFPSSLEESGGFRDSIGRRSSNNGPKYF